MRIRIPILAVLALLTLIATACGAQAPSTGAYGSPPTAAAAIPATGATATTVAPGAQPPASGGAAQVALATDPKLGSILVDGKGMTLYMFTKDSANTSNCYDKCAKSWPPLVTSSGSPAAAAGLDASKFGTTMRTDGTTQVTYNGWPLYYFAKDHQPGDVTGQGVGSVWYVLSPSGDPIK